MKSKIVSLVIMVFLLGAFIAAWGSTSVKASDGSPAIFNLNKFFQTDFKTKKRIFEYIHDNFPGLRKEISGFVAQTSPETPSKIREAEIRMLSEKYPGIFAKLPRQVLEDLTAQNPTLLMDIAVDVSSLICSKYPTLPSDLMKWRLEEKSRSKMRDMIFSKHRTLAQDVREVLKSKNYDKQLRQLRIDIQSMMLKKHP
jgi:hypothetical protein